MSFVVPLKPSPVAAAFPEIDCNSLDKLRLTGAEKSLLRSADNRSLDHTLSSTTDAKAYVRVLLKLLGELSGPSGPSSKVSRVKETLDEEKALKLLRKDPKGVVTHYAVTKLYEVVSYLVEKKQDASVTVASTFFSADGTLMDEWRPLLRILHLGGSGDAFAQRGAAQCLAYILMAACPSQKGPNNAKLKYSSVKDALQALVSWVASQLQSSSSTSLSLATPTLTALVTCTEARLMFANTGGIRFLSRHLKNKHDPMIVKGKRVKTKDNGPSIQQLYELCFCLWTMTYECNSSSAVRTNFARDGAVPALTDLVAQAPREKVVRVALSALRMVATCTAQTSPDLAGRMVIDGKYFLSEMIGCGLIKSIELMQDRQWKDPDVTEDLQVLHSLLQANYKDMSRWDVYRKEVESGHLEWGVLHTEGFFKENAKRIEGREGNFSLLKVLIALAASEDEDVAAVACYDIGEFVRHYPNGRSIAKRLGAKAVVMKMIEHENTELQRHALACVSKIMVQNWAAVH